MGCNCGSKQAPAQTWVHTAADGTKTAYKTETEANAAKVRRGGTVKPT